MGYYISLVQKAQRVAFRFISLKHLGHFLVVGSCDGSLRVRATSAFIGVTTKKYTAEETKRKEIRAFKKEPSINLLPFKVKVKLEKSGTLAIAPIKGVNMSLTMELTILPKAAPITTPTARSMTLPLKINCLKPLNINSQMRR